jgi:hypothetical protein
MRVHELLLGDMRQMMPYALIKLTSPRYQHCWLPVSRDYARPGAGGWTNYAMHIDDAMVFARDPRCFEGVWATTTDEACYLFASENEAAADYAERLKRLLAEYHFFHGDPPPALHFVPLVPKA